MGSRRTVAIFLAATMGLGLFSVEASAETKNSPIESSASLRPASGQLVGSISVSRGSFVYIRSNIFLGVDTKTLKRGVGYWPGTGRPGSLGNPTFAGHRTAATKPFNLLVNVRNGDRVQIYYGGVKYEYQVFDHFNKAHKGQILIVLYYSCTSRLHLIATPTSNMSMRVLIPKSLD